MTSRLESRPQSNRLRQPHLSSRMQLSSRMRVSSLTWLRLILSRQMQHWPRQERSLREAMGLPRLHEAGPVAVVYR